MTIEILLILYQIFEIKFTKQKNKYYYYVRAQYIENASKFIVYRNKTKWHRIWLRKQIFLDELNTNHAIEVDNPVVMNQFVCEKKIEIENAEMKSTPKKMK